MVSITRLIIKNDLQFKLTEEENKFFLSMEESEKKTVRKNVLNNIREGVLPLDILEDALEELKINEYKRYLSEEGLNKDIEEQTLFLEEIEGMCTRMTINLANENSDVENLLGPNIHETYGVGIKK